METLWKQDVARHFPGICLEGLRKTMKDLKSGKLVSGHEFEHKPYKIQSRSANHSTGSFIIQW